MHLSIDRTHLQLGRRFAVRTLFAGVFSWCIAAASLYSVATNAADTLPAVTVTEQDGGKTIEVSVGQKINVRLPSNPTTGYQWVVLGSPVPLKLVKSEYATDPQAAGRIGAGGTQTLGLAAESSGKVELILGYKRPWELDTPTVKTFSVTIIVR